jgi:hypothetical protein
VVTIGATDLGERTVADSIWGSGTPATWYVGVSTTVSADDGTNFTEPVGMNYARVTKTNNSANFPVAVTTSGKTVKTNATPITWPNPSGVWGDILEIGFFTALTGGTPVYTIPLENRIYVFSGATPVEVPASTLEIVVD